MSSTPAKHSPRKQPFPFAGSMNRASDSTNQQEIHFTHRTNEFVEDKHGHQQQRGKPFGDTRWQQTYQVNPLLGSVRIVQIYVNNRPYALTSSSGHLSGKTLTKQ